MGNILILNIREFVITVMKELMLFLIVSTAQLKTGEKQSPAICVKKDIIQQLKAIYVR